MGPDSIGQTTITYRQDRPAARIAICSAYVAVTCALLIYAFGLVNVIDFAESFREWFSEWGWAGRFAGGVIVALIFLPPGFILVRYLTPKQEVVFGGSALIIKAGRQHKSITYAEIASMMRHELMSSRLELYGHAGQLLYCFRTAADKAALSSIVRLITERIAFDTRNERRAVRYVRR